MMSCLGECSSESPTYFDEAYWDHDAAQPVLLIDEATEAITEALYRLRTGSALADRDVTAAGVALNDLFGGLKELMDRLVTSAGQEVVTNLSDRLQGFDRPTGALCDADTSGPARNGRQSSGLPRHTTTGQLA